MLDSHLIVKTHPYGNKKQTYVDGNLRFTVIKPTLLRVECQREGVFTDLATQIVWFRDKGEFEFKIIKTSRGYDIKTSECIFHYSIISKKVTSVTVDNKRVFLRRKDNLKGTARTLDGTFGPILLNDGIIGKNNVSMMKDSSLILNDKGMVEERVEELDYYYFVGEPRLVLNDFYNITGRPPMVPRYALGNWWSRYKEYTQNEYLELMNEFKNRNIPFTVATVDMDWHWVKLDEDFADIKDDIRPTRNGWTGYSWNTNLFPNYRDFIKKIKENNLALTLNLHPADGVRCHENMYKEMCKMVGQNPERKEGVKFAIESEKFWNAYFKVLHKPYEKEGVDFWWIDWQQGKTSAIKGYDPLWALNHYHTLDSALNKRPLILSRYSGLGSHRYPLGFSGDTAITWNVLKFQPFFTVNAANCGYITWSHDIGGHHFGSQRDEELYLRWIQFGVFSPVLRLHGTKSAIGKEPWNFKSVEDKAADFLRLRHALIPYIYTAYYNGYREGIPICEPIYYTVKKAYKPRNQYFFGSELLVCPVTTKKRKDGKARTKVYFPKGNWTNIFDKQVYLGNKFSVIESSLDSMPVFLKEGGILVLSQDKGNLITNPKSMKVIVSNGSGKYSLYEDDGNSQNYLEGKCVKTDFVKEGNSIEINTNGDISLIPQLRTYRIEFINIKNIKKAKVLLDNEEYSFKIEENSILIKNVSVLKKLKIEIN